MDAAQENLDRLTGGAAKSRSTGDASDLIIRERTFKLRRFLPGTENAESLVLLARKGKQDVQLLRFAHLPDTSSMCRTVTFEH